MVTVRLAAGSLELDLAPAIGGSIRRFDYVAKDRHQHLLRAASEDANDVLAMASFPLVPFANRIRGGRFECDGVTIALTPNLPSDPSPLHGQGWLGVWEVEASDTRTARLRFVHEGGEWPWHYEAWQDFALDEGGLTLTLGCRNLSPRPMPCGLAQHPYFPCDAATIIDLNVETAWTVDADTLPVEQVEPTGRYEVRDRQICGTDLDNSFEGWSGTADIRWRSDAMALRMSSPDASRFQIYSPQGQGYFAAEPVQNTVAALNMPQHRWQAMGIAMLAQGESRMMRMRFEVFDTD